MNSRSLPALQQKTPRPRDMGRSARLRVTTQIAKAQGSRRFDPLTQGYAAAFTAMLGQATTSSDKGLHLPPSLCAHPPWIIPSQHLKYTTIINPVLRFVKRKRYILPTVKKIPVLQYCY